MQYILQGVIPVDTIRSGSSSKYEYINVTGYKVKSVVYSFLLEKFEAFLLLPSLQFLFINPFLWVITGTAFSSLYFSTFRLSSEIGTYYS